MARESQNYFDYTSRQGNQFGASHFASQAQQYTSAQVYAENDVVVIQQLGDDLAAVVDSLIARMNSIIAFLQANWTAWINAQTECGQWQVHVMGAQ